MNHYMEPFRRCPLTRMILHYVKWYFMLFLVLFLINYKPSSWRAGWRSINFHWQIKSSDDFLYKILFIIIYIYIYILYTLYIYIIYLFISLHLYNIYTILLTKLVLFSIHSELEINFNSQSYQNRLCYWIKSHHHTN